MLSAISVLFQSSDIGYCSSHSFLKPCHYIFLRILSGVVKALSGLTLKFAIVKSAYVQ